MWKEMADDHKDFLTTRRQIDEELEKLNDPLLYPENLMMTSNGPAEAKGKVLT
jgi:hypothetical protein